MYVVATATTVDNSEQKFGFDKAIFLTLVEQTYEIGRAKLLEFRAGRSPQPDLVLVLVRSERLHHFVFMSLENATKRISDVVNLENNHPDLFACGALQVEFPNDYLLPSRIVVDKALNDVFGISVKSCHFGSVVARGRCGMRTKQAAYSARVLYVETAGEQVAQNFGDMVGCDEVLRLVKSLELFLNSR